MGSIDMEDVSVIFADMHEMLRMCEENARRAQSISMIRKYLYHKEETRTRLCKKSGNRRLFL